MSAGITFLHNVKSSPFNSYNFMAYKKNLTRSNMLLVQNIQNKDYGKEMKQER